jgi:hypothetical protein
VVAGRAKRDEIVESVWVAAVCERGAVVNLEPLARAAPCTPLTVAK